MNNVSSTPKIELFLKVQSRLEYLAVVDDLCEFERTLVLKFLCLNYLSNLCLVNPTTFIFADSLI